jgi:hypothetical protein
MEMRKIGRITGKWFHRENKDFSFHITAKPQKKPSIPKNGNQLNYHHPWTSDPRSLISLPGIPPGHPLEI